MDIDELLSLLTDYNRAVADYEECRAGCEYDVGYYCANQANYRDRKKAELTLALNTYIDSRIRHVLSGTD